MATSNEPKNSELSGVSDHQLLVLILTELRLHTEFMFQREVREQEVDGLRAELMNNIQIVDTDSATATQDANR